MSLDLYLSRRALLRTAAAATGSAFILKAEQQSSAKAQTGPQSPLQQFDYGAVQFSEGRQEQQLHEVHAVLMELDENRLLKPYRIREGLPAPGEEMGGWYDAYDFAPSHAYGQWLSALSRYYAITGDPRTQAKVHGMVMGLRSTIDPAGKFYVDNRFPAYIYDKLVCGLIDAHEFAHDTAALGTLGVATEAVSSHLPEKALTRPEMEARPHKDISYCWDESYTLPENLLLAWQRSGNALYRRMAARYLLNAEYFDPLARGENVLPGKHAYSHVNALSSAAMAYIVLGEDKYFHAAVNGFRFVQEQSFATGGWGPDERFVPPGSGGLGESLKTSHSSFETPCGSYGHFKIARYLLRLTRDSRYGDSMEQVMLNTVLGAKPLEADGAAFYYSDYNNSAKRVYFKDKWPCCSGTLPQIAADYRISAYFHDPQGVFVNLYLPSTLRWEQNGSQVSLVQSGSYPSEGQIQIDVKASRPGEFGLYLRIPEWAGDGTRCQVNGKRTSDVLHPGTFARIARTWQTGDRVELELPMSMRLEQVDREHPETVALMRGPLVLFPITDQTPKVTRQQLLSATQVATTHDEWQVDTPTGPLRLCPFTVIGDRRYAGYLQVG